MSKRGAEPSNEPYNSDLSHLAEMTDPSRPKEPSKLALYTEIFREDIREFSKKPALLFTTIGLVISSFFLGKTGFDFNKSSPEDKQSAPVFRDTSVLINSLEINQVESMPALETDLLNPPNLKAELERIGRDTLNKQNSQLFSKTFLKYLESPNADQKLVEQALEWFESHKGLDSGNFAKLLANEFSAVQLFISQQGIEGSRSL